jgi:hypothetical protein
MPTQPIRATPGGGGWMKDSSGMMAPVGSSTSVKELTQLPKEMRDIALGANTLIRGNLAPELWPDLAMLLAIAPHHRLTLIFVANVVAGSKAQYGQATTDFLQGLVNMLVPNAMSTYLQAPQGRKRDIQKHKFRKNQDGKIADEDNE